MVRGSLSQPLLQSDRNSSEYASDENVSGEMDNDHSSDRQHHAEPSTTSQKFNLSRLYANSPRNKKPTEQTSPGNNDISKIENVPDGAKDQWLSGRIYANNAPRIRLETITARTATFVIICTYMFFIIGFSVDFYTTYRSFSSSNYEIGSLPCDQVNQTVTSLNPYWGCFSGNTWNSTVSHLQNVISINLKTEQLNATVKLQTGNTTFDIVYNLNLWACYTSGGCGDQFATFSEYNSNPNIWQQVMKLSEKTVLVDQKKDTTSTDYGKGLSLTLFPNTFQNQESVPTNGLVKSYFISVEFLEDPYSLYTEFSGDTLLYKFDVVSRPKQRSIYVLTAIINLVTIVVFVYYVHVLYKLGYRNALPEQKWVVGYFFLLILFQNPVYYTIVWYPASTDIVSASYCSYVFDQLSQAGLFTLWLFYADSVRRKVRSKLLFYLPKLFFGAFILSIGLSVLTFQFPNVDSTNESDRSPVESVVNWSDKEKLDFISLSVIYLLLLWIWAIYWFISLYQTSQHLKRLPYMNTRYLQLSYRFFLLQASLVTIYYVAQYGSVIYLLSLGAQTDSESTSSLTDDINTLFRQQTQLFGKMLFLTVYAFILAYLFLPVDLGDGNTRGLKAVLQSTYVISESEHKELVRLRRAALRGIKKNFVNQLVMINQLMTLVGSNRKSDVFCVDIAILLRNISFEAYHDPPSKKTASGYEGSMSLKEVDSHIKSANQSSGTDEFVMVDFHYNEDHEVFCFVCKNTVTGKLIVAFRGTASKKQMEDNLNYSQRFIDWLKLDTAADYNDGLDVPKDFLPQSGQSILAGIALPTYGYGPGQSGATNDFDDFDEEDVSEGNDEDEDDNLMSFLQRQFSIGSNENDHPNNKSPLNAVQKDFDEEFGNWPESEVSGKGDTGRSARNRNTIVETAGQVEKGIKRVFTGALGATNQGINTVVGTTTGIVLTAASNTPVLKAIVQPFVHCGFWEAYFTVREFLHIVLRRELIKNPQYDLYFTGHSLGGALASFAALDITLHTVPRVNNFLRYRATSLAADHTTTEQRGNFLSSIARPFLPQSERRRHDVNTALVKSSTNDENDYNENRLQSKTIIKSRVDGKPIQMVKRSKIFMYSYGCPKVGNGIFSQFYDRVVPNSYRIVVDGDLVTGLPPGGYFFSTYVHIGTEILIDSVGAGSIIIDPSFVERWLRTTLKSSVALHSLFAYRKGLLGIRLAAEFMRKYAEDFRGLDPLKVALHAGPIITQKVDELLAPPDSSIEGSKADPPTDKQIVIEREYQISETVSEESAVPEVAVTQEGLVSAMKDLSALTKETTGEISEKKEDEDTARENLDAKHYAHDVEFASTLMSQFEGAGGVSVYGIGKTGIDALGNISSWLYGTTTGIFYGESTENTTEKNLVEEDKVF